MPRVRWDLKLNEILVYNDEGYATGSQDSHSPSLVASKNTALASHPTPNLLTLPASSIPARPNYVSDIKSHKSILLFCFVELPYGWEKVEDPHYGTYFIE